MVFCWHKWRPWSELIAGYNNEKCQYRECESCQKIQFRTIGYCNGTDADKANELIKEQRR